MEVIIEKQYLKDLRKVPKYILSASDHIIDQLKQSESLQTSGLDYQKCEGGKKSEKYYRIRVGDWRIGVALKHRSIIIITILIRGRMYKKFLPK